MRSVRAAGAILALATVLAAPALSQNALDGFDPDADGPVRAIAAQADGRIIIGGDFTNVAGTARSHLARLNVDGSLDSGFNPGASGNGSLSSATVYSLAVQSDGKILVGGSFTRLGGQARANIGRLKQDGTVDASFNPGADDVVRRLTLQGDGKILVAGRFTNLGGQNRNYLGRLNSNGSLDTSFNPGADGAILTGAVVYSLAVQASGKILVGGEFTTLGGQTRNYLGRLKADGSLDADFNPGAGGGGVVSLLVQVDGKILVGGYFTALVGQPRNHLARLNADGSLDTAFNPGADSAVFSIAIQADGRILVSGAFTTLGGQTRHGLGRLNADGSLDTDVNPVTDGAVFCLAEQADATILIGGDFTRIDGQVRNSIARLNADGSVDTTLNRGADNGVFGLAVQPDGKILVGGYFNNLAGQTHNHIGRLYSDGSPDGTFNPIAGTSLSTPVFDLIVQPDGQVLAGGEFATLDGQPRNALGRLDADGGLDGIFNPGVGAGSFTFVQALAVQADGKMVVGGNFTTLGGQARANIGRLNADGSLDPTFDPGADFYLNCLAVQADGKILVGGQIASLAGQTRHYIGRLNADGSLDPAFNPGADYVVHCLVVQADGKVLVAGAFGTLGGQTRNNLGRLNPDGSLDSTFNPGPGGPVATLALQVDGKILLGGAFNSVGGQPRSFIARLNADGSTDPAFNPGADAVVVSLAVQADGKILAGGQFTNLGGQPRKYLGRLTSGSAALQRLAIDAGGTTATWSRSGAGPEIEQVTFEQSTDGVSYTALGSGRRISGGWRLTGLSLPSGQIFYLRARGRATGGQFSGSSGLIESVAQFHLADTLPPRIFCPPATNVQCAASVPPTFLGGSVSDNSDPSPVVTWVGDVTNGVCPAVITRTYRATDAAGNTGECAQIITVQDNTAPVLSGQGTNMAIECPATPVFIPPTAIDNCDANPTITFADTTTPGASAGTYSVTRTWLATDRCGNTSAPVSQTITVQDTTPPAISCPTNLVVEFTGQTGAVVRFVVLAADACDSSVVAKCAPDSGSTFAIGVTTVVCTASDASSNSASCSLSVEVLGSLGVKQKVLAELSTLRATMTDTEDRKVLDDTIVHLTRSLQPELWVDQTHVQHKHGIRVFQEEKETVESLAELIAGKSQAIPGEILRRFVGRIVRADRLLASVAIDDAIDAGAAPKQIAAAQSELVRGDREAATGRRHQGIEHYRLAWEQATHGQARVIAK